MAAVPQRGRPRATPDPQTEDHGLLRESFPLDQGLWPRPSSRRDRNGSTTARGTDQARGSPRENSMTGEKRPKKKRSRFVSYPGDLEVETKPVVKLIGEDGNAFAILGACQRAAQKAGWSKEQWSKVRDELMSGDYNHLLAVAM